MQPFLLRVVAAIRSLAQEPQQRFALLYGAGARVVRGVKNSKIFLKLASASAAFCANGEHTQAASKKLEKKGPVGGR